MCCISCIRFHYEEAVCLRDGVAGEAEDLQPMQHEDFGRELREAAPGQLFCQHSDCRGLDLMKYNYLYIQHCTVQGPGGTMRAGPPEKQSPQAQCSSHLSQGFQRF